MLAALQITPVVLSLMLLGAHFLRSGEMVLLGAVVLVMALLPVRRRWAAKIVQFALVLGALEWLRTLIVLAQARAQTGQSATRLVIILGVVTAITALSPLAFQRSTLGRAFGIDQKTAGKRPGS